MVASGAAGSIANVDVVVAKAAFIYLLTKTLTKYIVNDYNTPLYDSQEEHMDSLYKVRSQLRITQAEIARRANTTKQTVSDAERGKRIRLTTAYAILKVINEERIRQSLEKLEPEDLDWNIFR